VTPKLPKVFSEQNYFGAYIDARANRFCSRTFRVQYQEQEININDACLFRLEINARKVLLLHVLYCLAAAVISWPLLCICVVIVCARWSECSECRCFCALN
jgi:hypothetical protein